MLNCGRVFSKNKRLRTHHGRFHSQKAEEYSTALNNWLKNQAASDYDKMAASSILKDLRSALDGN